MSTIADTAKAATKKLSQSIDVTKKPPSTSNQKSPKIMLKNKISNEIKEQIKKSETPVTSPKSIILMKEQLQTPKSKKPITIEVEDVTNQDEPLEKQKETLGTNRSRHSGEESCISLRVDDLVDEKITKQDFDDNLLRVSYSSDKLSGSSRKIKNSKRSKKRHIRSRSQFATSKDVF